MKKIALFFLLAAMMISVAACGANGALENTSESTTTGTTSATVPPQVNAGALKAGIYTANASYSMGEINTSLNFELVLKADGTFALGDGEAEKENGEYALTGDCYTLSYNDGRSATFVVRKDGTLKMTSALPYGTESIDLALAGDIVFTFKSEIFFEMSFGSYEGEVINGNKRYEFTLVLGTDGGYTLFSQTYVNGEAGDLHRENGTYEIDGNKFSKKSNYESEGEVIADNTLKAYFVAESSHSALTEVIFTEKICTVANGAYAGVAVVKREGAGDITYRYKVTLGEENTFSYNVTYHTEGYHYEGRASNGTYRVEGNKFIFKDADGSEYAGRLINNDTLFITLRAREDNDDVCKITLTPFAFMITPGDYNAYCYADFWFDGQNRMECNLRLKQDGTFYYDIVGIFEDGGHPMEITYKEGTYTVEGNKVTFIYSENGKTEEGVLIEDRTLKISVGTGMGYPTEGICDFIFEFSSVQPF